MDRAGGGLGDDGRGGALRKVLWGGDWSGSMASPEGWAPRAQWVGAAGGSQGGARRGSQDEGRVGDRVDVLGEGSAEMSAHGSVFGWEPWKPKVMDEREGGGGRELRGREGVRGVGGRSVAGKGTFRMASPVKPPECGSPGHGTRRPLMEGFQVPSALEASAMSSQDVGHGTQGDKGPGRAVLGRGWRWGRLQRGAHQH